MLLSIVFVNIYYSICFWPLLCLSLSIAFVIVNCVNVYLGVFAISTIQNFIILMDLAFAIIVLVTVHYCVSLCPLLC